MGYDQACTYAGTLANAETTSIVLLTLNLLALQQRNPQFNPFFFWWSFPFAIFVILGTVAGVGVTAVFLFWDQRRRKKNYSL